MGCPVYELQQRMSSREFAEWMAYDRIEPVGSLRDDYHTAMICSLIANVNRAEGVEPFKIEDFLFRMEISTEEQPAKKSPEEIWGLLKAWAVMAGGAK